MSGHDKTTITALPDGPLLVKNLARLSNRKGPLTTDDTLALCRCGASANKPFCDGSHSKIGFSSARSAERMEDRRVAYSGATITIYDNRSLCAHAGVCTDALPGVFRMKQEPWIDPDAASVEEIIEIIKRCPSGALGYAIDGKPPAQKQKATGIFIAPDGPYVVTGEIEFIDSEFGDGANPHQYTLCRCGASKNKPFCDGSHWSIEFKDEQN